MARTITAPVGRLGGVNRPADVRTVQELLNKVAPGSGEPSPPLDEDGICGPKTIDAIQRFQLHHFGFRGADGRVDPDGPTLAKLNEFDLPPARRSLSIRRVGFPGTFLDPKRPEDWFFEVSNRLQPAERAVYHLRRDFEQAPLGVPVAFAGEIADFVTERAASGLETRGASYLTEYLLGRLPDEPGPDKARPTSSRLGLVFATESALEVERLEIAYPAHIEPPSLAELDARFPAPGAQTIRRRGGRFVRVR